MRATQTHYMLLAAQMNHLRVEKNDELQRELGRQVRLTFEGAAF